MLQLNQKLVLRERYAKFYSVLSKEDSAVAITKLNITETERLFCYKKQTKKQTKTIQIEVEQKKQKVNPWLSIGAEYQSCFSAYDSSLISLEDSNCFLCFTLVISQMFHILCFCQSFNVFHLVLFIKLSWFSGYFEAIGKFIHEHEGDKFVAKEACKRPRFILRCCMGTYMTGALINGDASGCKESHFYSLPFGEAEASRC